MAYGANGCISGPKGQRSGPRGNALSPIGARTQQPVYSSFPAANLSKYGVDLPFYIRGVSRDNTGAALGNCETYLLDANRALVNFTMSDASGNYSFQVPGNSSFYQVHWYQVGSPDRAGITKNTLQGVN